MYLNLITFSAQKNLKQNECFILFCPFAIGKNL